MAGNDLQPQIRRKGAEVLARLSHEEREKLLIKCWMSHDARWFAAAAFAFGVEAANRLNQMAVHEAGKAEAKRIARALQLPAVADLDGWLLAQEAFIGLLGPDLLEYNLVRTGDDSYELRVQRCFAHENVTRAGVARQYECGILPRLTGWLEGLGVRYEMSPSPGPCPKVDGRECVYRFKIGPQGS